MSSAPSEFTENGDNELFNDPNATASLVCDRNALEVALQEFEGRKKAFVQDQMKVDADIQAVRRTMQLVAACGL